MIRNCTFDCIEIKQVDGITGYEDSYANITDRSIKCALWMREQGVQPGDVVGVCTHNQLDTAIPLIASLFIGAICNPWWESCLDEGKKKIINGEKRIY